MKTIFLKIYYKIWSFFMNLNTVDLPATVPEDYYVNSLIMKIEPILNTDSKVRKGFALRTKLYQLFNQ